jgi:hypothetical protein
MPLKPSYRGYVYLIGSHRFGWYKIGKANRPHVRLSEIGVLLPFRVEVICIWGTSSPYQLESFLHREYSSNRLNGEWFSFKWDLVLEIKKRDMPMFAELVEEGQALKFSNIEDDIIDRSGKKYANAELRAVRCAIFNRERSRYLQEHGLDESNKEHKREANRAIKKLMKEWALDRAWYSVSSQNLTSIRDTHTGEAPGGGNNPGSRLM